MIQTQPLEVKDFSLGITDYFLDGEPNAARRMDNLALTVHAKPQTRWGCQVLSTQMPLGTVRTHKILSLQSRLLAFQANRCFFLNPNWTELLGPASGPVMPTGNANSILSDAFWQDHIFLTNSELTSPQKVYIDGTGVFRARNAGLPVFSSGVSVTNPTGTGASYLYAVVLRYNYNVGSVQYVNRGAVYYVPTAVTGGAITALNTTTVTLPTALPVVENWDAAGIQKEIYRTIDNGDTFYLVGTVPLAQASFIDNVPDSALQSREQIYVTGGIVANDAPPKCKYVHVVNDYGYWAHALEGSELIKTRVYQSKAGDPDSVPSTFFVDAEQEITGLSSIFDRPMVFCDRFIYRIDNFFEDDGTGGMILRRLDDRAGCVSDTSIVQTHVGIFWAGQTGFYWSDGFRVVCVSDHINQSYKDFVLSAARRGRIQGTFDSSNQRVYWSVCKDGATDEPELMLVMDLKFPFQPGGNRRGATFTTFSGKDSFSPSSVLFANNSLYRGDRRGYVFRHSSEFNTDLKVDVVRATNLWDQQTIVHNYESCFLDFGSKFYRKFVPRILVSADNTTNLSLAIFSSNDNNRVTGELKPIRYASNVTWGDELPLWGTQNIVWNAQGLVEEWRRFPSGGLRCNYKQVRLTNAEVIIVDSSLIGTVTINSSLKTATLGSGNEWINGVVDYLLYLENDNYTRGYRIVSRTPTTLIFEDADNAAPTFPGPYRWVIRGQPKGEVLLLNGYVLHWSYISKSHTPFSAASLGGNPS
jgi:hypothetical protein